MIKTGNFRKQRLEQLAGYAKVLAQAVRILVERKQILVPLLEDEAIKDALKERLRGTLGVHVYNHLAPLLAQDLVRDLVRLYLDEDERSGSLLNLYRKASEPKINKALREQFINIYDRLYNVEVVGSLSKEQADAMFANIREEKKKELEADFDNTWTAIHEAIKQLRLDAVADKLKTYRNKYHAHLQMSPLGEEPLPFDVESLGLTFNDVLEFADRYIEPALELNRIITGTVYDIPEFSELHLRYSTAMWRALAGLDAEKAK